MPPISIIIKGLRYYYYDTYSTREKAYKSAIYWKGRRPKTKYFIIEKQNWTFNNTSYELYLTKIARLY